jgi:BirA family biotin operon repressor/biotin-[acetyl-CoA-carboxylase] ligase
MSQYYRILRILADGHWHTPKDLTQNSADSRAALLEKLKRMESDGLAFEWLGEQKLRWLNPSMPLSAQQIRDGLSLEVRGLISSIEVYNELASTSTFMRETGVTQGRICLAEKQRAGIGRRGRTWHSPLGTNIYMSLGWRFDATPAHLSGLTLGVGIKLAETLNAYAVVGLKWPNDLYLHSRKLGGILVETRLVAEGSIEVIMGIGINTNMRNTTDIDQPWTSLCQHHPSQESIDRNKLVSELLENLLPFLNTFTETGHDYIVHHWPKFDLAYQQGVTVHLNGKQFLGIGAGIDDKFQFLLQQDHGVSKFSSADVSLRL